MKSFKNGDDIIIELSNRIISDIDNGYINAVYHKSKTSISFYVNDVNKGKEPYLTLRLSNHKPSADNYIYNNPNILPHLTTNISIEFPKLLRERVSKNKANMRVYVSDDNTKILPFDIISYEYKYDTFTSDDNIEKIYINLITFNN